jgi:hypothetical protein
MQHENGADAGENRPQQMMRAGKIQCLQSGPDDGVAKLLHCARWLIDRNVIPPVNEEGLNKPLSAAVSHSSALRVVRLVRSVISGLTAPQRFVFSVFPVSSDFAVPFDLRDSAQPASA